MKKNKKETTMDIKIKKKTTLPLEALSLALDWGSVKASLC